MVGQSRPMDCNTNALSIGHRRGRYDATGGMEQGLWQDAEHGFGLRASGVMRPLSPIGYRQFHSRRARPAERLNVAGSLRFASVDSVSPFVNSVRSVSSVSRS